MTCLYPQENEEELKKQRNVNDHIHKLEEQLVADRRSKANSVLSQIKLPQMILLHNIAYN